MNPLPSPNPRTRIGIFSPSSPVSEHTVNLGAALLRERGFSVRVDPQTFAVDFIHAGSDTQRAETLWRLANDPDLEILWTARGGYGATKLLPLLESLTLQHGPPPRKLLAGFSDVTALHEFTRHRWGWATLHAPMPGSLNFTRLGPHELDATLSLIRGERPMDLTAGHDKANRYDLAAGRTLNWLHRPPGAMVESISGRVFGGNLAVLNYLSGTPWQPGPISPDPSDVQSTSDSGERGILFLEDLDEGFYRIDAFLNQLSQVGVLDHVSAIVLGTFSECTDSPGKILDEPINAADQLSRALDQGIQSFKTKPLRPTYDEPSALTRITEPLAERHGLGVVCGLPVGHGPDFAPLPLGAQCTITTDGQMVLDAWDWLR